MMYGMHLRTLISDFFISEIGKFLVLREFMIFFLFFSTRESLVCHMNRCIHRRPPGDEIYKDPIQRISIFEVDGYFQRVYCENICYLSKLFLDHKRFDRFTVHEFFFYVLCDWGENGEYHFRGYFSKDKIVTHRNLSCIMSLPCFQRRGIGSFLIDFSYELSRRSKQIGSPERPLSDLGKRTYLRYWLGKILEVLTKLNIKDQMSIQMLSELTYIKEEDLVM